MLQHGIANGITAHKPLEETLKVAAAPCISVQISSTLLGVKLDSGGREINIPEALVLVQRVYSGFAVAD
jgi:hypothetical protein